MTELKSCPGCGNENPILTVIAKHEHRIANMPDYEGSEFVECHKCSFATSSVEAWNPPEMVERAALKKRK